MYRVTACNCLEPPPILRNRIFSQQAYDMGRKPRPNSTAPTTKSQCSDEKTTSSLFTLKKSVSGGGGEIRTHGRISPTLDFKSSALNRSATPPRIAKVKPLMPCLSFLGKRRLLLIEAHLCLLCAVAQNAQDCFARINDLFA